MMTDLHSSSVKTAHAIIDEASEWLIALESAGDSATESEAFLAWLRRSPLHVKEFLRAEATWVALNQIDAEKRIDVTALLRDDSSVVCLSPVCPQKKTTNKSIPWVKYTAVAASLVAVLLLALISPRLIMESSAIVYETALGEQKRIVLEDGSVVELNTQSKIRVALSEQRREIDLLKGEALFTVAKNPARPFVVNSPYADFIALGTQFNVYRQPNRTVLTVLEGRVGVEAESSIQAVELVAGEQTEIRPSKTHELRIRALDNPQSAVAWRELRLIFDGVPLSEVIAEFNRYNRRRLMVQDTALGALRISGVFSAEHPEALVNFLRRKSDVRTLAVSDTELMLQPAL